jgi:hypothetical protein
MANTTIYPYGVGGQTPSGIGLNAGTFADAYDLAKENNYIFPWMLIDEDEEGEPIKKMIWHTGNGEFIDAIGAEIDGKKNGVTIKVNADCDVLIGSTTYQLSEGTNFFTFDDLNYDGTSVINTFSFRDRGTSTANLTYAEEIDFFGMTLSCGYSGLLQGQQSLKKVSRLRVVRPTNPNANYMTNLLANCPSLVSVEISGSGLGGQAFTSGLANCPKLLKVDMSKFNPNVAWASKSIQGFAKDCFAIETLDVSGFSTGSAAVFDDWLIKNTNKSDGNRVLKKFIIGNFSNAGATSVNHFMPKVRNCVLICKSSTPPVLKNCAFVDSTAQDQYSTTYDWLSYTETVNGNTVIGCKFSAIYVPSDAVTAYKTNTYIENGTVGVTGWSKYADIIHDIAEYDG